ncbi:MAG: hypothetical protein AAGA85_20730 [Bacteroidota bacterium]
MKRIDPHLLLSIGVLIVSFAALFVSIRQATLLNRQTEILLQQMKSSAWPSLAVDMHFSMQNDSVISAYCILVGNDGLGPAIVDGVRVLVDGKPTSSWLELIALLGPPEDLSATRSASSLYQKVLSSGEEMAFLDLGQNEGLMQFLYEAGDRIKIEICYRSIYGERWLVTRDILTAEGSSSARQVEACEWQDGDNFLD